MQPSHTQRFSLHIDIYIQTHTVHTSQCPAAVLAAANAPLLFPLFPPSLSSECLSRRSGVTSGDTQGASTPTTARAPWLCSLQPLAMEGMPRVRSTGSFTEVRTQTNPINADLLPWHNRTEGRRLEWKHYQSLVARRGGPQSNGWGGGDTGHVACILGEYVGHAHGLAAR